jgi:hypothetical protein
MKGAALPGAPGAPASGGRATAILTRPWFWLLVLLPFWALPLVKSLGAEYPEPPPGHEREPETFRLADLEGRDVSAADLGGYLLVVRPLRMGTEEETEADFVAFRECKARLRGLGSTIVQVLLVDGGGGGRLEELVAAKRARKPNNLFLYDEGGVVLERLRASAANPTAEVLVLDRHARIRGAYDASAADGDRFAQDLGKLANWIGCDPPPGQGIRR